MKILRTPFLLTIVLSAFLAGCASTGSSSLAGEMDSIPWENVKIFRIQDEIPEYVHVSDMDFHGVSETRSESEVYDILKRKVARIGANGVIILEDAPPFNKETSGEFFQEFVVWSSVFDLGTAIALGSVFSSARSKDHPHGKAAAIHIYSFE